MIKRTPTSDTETPMSRYLSERMRKMPHLTQIEIARRAGFKTPNIISMMASGHTKVPLDRVPALARALETDESEMFRLALEQLFDRQTVFQIIDSFHTPNEKRILGLMRELTHDTDPELTPALEEGIRKAYAEKS